MLLIAVRIQHSNDGKNSWKFNGIKAGFSMSPSSNKEWANLKDHGWAGRMTFMHFPDGADCWAAGGVRDTTSNTYINKYNYKICNSSSDPHLPFYPSGERMPVRLRLGPCPDQCMHSPIRVLIAACTAR